MCEPAERHPPPPRTSPAPVNPRGPGPIENTMDARSSSKSRVLLVDDDATVLSALMRQLRSRFEVSVATSGMEGLKAIADGGHFAVVVSDMRMPRMDGAAFLACVRQAAPESTRMLLTGSTDIEATTDAVNRGNIFRLLFKPCSPDALQDALDAAVAQHRLVMAERELLEQTLKGSVRALAEALALASPAAFGRAQRIKRLALELEGRVATRPSWALELAATLSQLGALSVPATIVEQAYLGEPLTDDEQLMLDRVPEMTERLLAAIPRLDPVLDILRLRARNFEGPTDGPRGEQIPLGARVLRLAADYEALEAQGLHATLAVAGLRARSGAYDPKLLDHLSTLRVGVERGPELREVGVSHLRTGMVLAADLKSVKGVLLLARGTEITEPVLRWFGNRRSDLRLPIRVVLPALETIAGNDGSDDGRPAPLARAV